MLLILSVHTQDAARAVKTLETSARLGYTNEHPLIVMYPQTAMGVIGPVLEAARKGFKTVKDGMIHHDIQDGWPIGPTMMFQAAVMAAKTKHEWDQFPPYDGELKGGKGCPNNHRTPLGHFFFWEPDMIPVHAGWMERMETDYNLGAKPFMGALMPTYKRDIFSLATTASPAVYGPKRQEGYHMVGSGMYPRDMKTWVDWVGSIPLDEAYDVALQGSILRTDGRGGYAGFTQTNLISHNWNSENYRITKDGDVMDIQCDSHADNPGQGKFSLCKNPNQGPILIHGCKDESVYDIVAHVNGWDSNAVIHSETKDVAIEPTKWTGDMPKNIQEVVQLGNMQEMIAKAVAEALAAQKKPVSKKVAKETPVEATDGEIYASYNQSKDWKGTIKKFGVSPKRLKAIRDARETVSA